MSIGPQDDPFAVLDAFDSEDAASTADVPEGAVGGGWIGYLGYGLTDREGTPSPAGCRCRLGAGPTTSCAATARASGGSSRSVPPTPPSSTS
ncbi:hypothetical protein ACFQ0O_02035 [Saccharopolyspora spinosporotrichia]